MQSASSIQTMKSSLMFGLFGRELFIKEKLKNLKRSSTLVETDAKRKSTIKDAVEELTNSQRMRRQASEPVFDINTSLSEI